MLMGVLCELGQRAPSLLCRCLVPAKDNTVGSNSTLWKYRVVTGGEQCNHETLKNPAIPVILHA